MNDKTPEYGHNHQCLWILWQKLTWSSKDKACPTSRGNPSMTIPLASGIFMIFCLISVIVVSWKTVKANSYHIGREFIKSLISTNNSFQTCISQKKQKKNNNGFSLSGRVCQNISATNYKARRCIVVIIITDCFFSKSVKEEISFSNVVAISMWIHQGCRLLKTPLKKWMRSWVINKVCSDRTLENSTI